MFKWGKGTKHLALSAFIFPVLPFLKHQKSLKKPHTLYTYFLTPFQI